ncbi:MAG: hypothetical protein EPN25_09485 [Nitrospirae bacterium]|nr:MAG: hypothetical protein EPN25_09485 [Nitrospirota bacterium]
MLIALFLLAVSGLMLHYRIHNFMVADRLHPGSYLFDGTKFMASLLPAIDALVVTALFMSRRTAPFGYLLNGLLVIFGTILMAHFSIAEMTAKSIPLQAMLLKSTLPDIGICWGDFFIGKALYDLYMKGTP